MESVQDGNNEGSMWALDQKLDQPMDEEAGKLRHMNRDKVCSLSLFYSFCSFLFKYLTNSC